MVLFDGKYDLYRRNKMSKYLSIFTLIFASILIIAGCSSKDTETVSSTETEVVAEQEDIASEEVPLEEYEEEEDVPPLSLQTENMEFNDPSLTDPWISTSEYRSGEYDIRLSDDGTNYTFTVVKAANESVVKEFVTTPVQLESGALGYGASPITSSEGPGYIFGNSANNDKFIYLPEKDLKIQVNDKHDLLNYYENGYYDHAANLFYGIDSDSGHELMALDIKTGEPIFDEFGKVKHIDDINYGGSEFLIDGDGEYVYLAYKDAGNKLKILDKELNIVAERDLTDITVSPFFSVPLLGMDVSGERILLYVQHEYKLAEAIAELQITKVQ